MTELLTLEELEGLERLREAARATQHDAVAGPQDRTLMDLHKEQRRQRRASAAYQLALEDQTPALLATARQALTPVPMVLHCPCCGAQHIDAPEPERGWTNPPHRSHLCGVCQTVWRPAAVYTEGVAILPTALGSSDTWSPFSPERTVGAELARLRSLLFTPIIDDFMRAVPAEAAHQQERWGSEHDGGKSPEDWFWLLGYLSGKILHALKEDRAEKALHHTISSAALLLNWHQHLARSRTTMRPGIAEPDE